MKTLLILLIFPLSLLTSNTSDARDFFADYPGEFQSLSFSHEGIKFKITLFVSDTLSWVDFVQIEYPDGPGGYSFFKDTRFITRFRENADVLRGAPAMSIDLADDSSVTVAKDGSFVRFGKGTRGPHMTLDFQRRVSTPFSYHSRFPTATTYSPIFVLGTETPVNRHPRSGEGWYPSELKIYLDQKDILKISCEEFFILRLEAESH